MPHRTVKRGEGKEIGFWVSVIDEWPGGEKAGGGGKVDTLKR